MVNEHIVDYHLSPSGIKPKDTPPHISTDSSGVYLSPEYLLNFFSNVYIPRWLGKIFKFVVLRPLENAFVCQKIESVHFPKQKSPQVEN